MGRSIANLDARRLLLWLHIAMIIAAYIPLRCNGRCTCTSYDNHRRVIAASVCPMQAVTTFFSFARAATSHVCVSLNILLFDIVAVEFFRLAFFLSLRFINIDRLFGCDTQVNASSLLAELIVETFYFDSRKFFFVHIVIKSIRRALFVILYNI